MSDGCAERSPGPKGIGVPDRLAGSHPGKMSEPGKAYFGTMTLSVSRSRHEEQVVWG